MDLSNYVRIGRYALPEPTTVTAPNGFNLLAQEASGVTYNWDTNTLFIVGDGGRSIVEVSTTGALIGTMTFAAGGSPQGTEFYDPEGLAYIGGGQFVMTEERDRTAVKFTYVAGDTLDRAEAQTVDLGTFSNNIGLEGVTFDPLTGGFIFAKEKLPEGLFQTTIDFNAGTASNGSATTENSINLFDPALLGLADFADVFSLANVASLAGTASASNLLVLSQESGMIVETDRAGNIISTLTLQSDAGNPLDIANQQHEGITVGNDGTIYVVSENGGGDINHPQLWVFAPSLAVNHAPTAVGLINPVTSLLENTSTAARVKVADLSVTDDGLGSNGFSLSGSDAASFEIVGSSLYIKAGTVLDFETRPTFNVTVNVDDTSVGATPDATANYTLNLVDVLNEGNGTMLYVSEVAPWSSGNSPVGADWFEVSNTGSSAIDITGWKVDDNSNSFASAIALNGVSSIGAGESVIFIEGGAAQVTAFVNTWFGGVRPAGLQIGTYSGSGIGLSTGGDAVNLYNAAGVLQANVVFGVSDATSPFQTFDNAAGINNATISTLSNFGVNAAFVVGSLSEIGSPGEIALNVAPIASDDTLSSIDEDSGARAISFASLLANDLAGPPNEASQTLTITAVTNAVGGTAVISGTDVIFTPDANFNGTASFDYTVQDNGQDYGANVYLSDTGAVSFSVAPANDAPALTGVQGTPDAGTEDLAYTITNAVLTTGFTDVDGDTLTAANVSASNGTVVNNGNGTWTVTPTYDFNGAVTLSYDVTDGNGGSVAASLDYSVGAVVDAGSVKGPSSSINPYMIGIAPNVTITAIASVGDTIGTKLDGSPYKMVGIPDGLGAFDNGDGTFTLLMNHELTNAAGVARAHGGIGAFVSQWVIDKATLQVVSAEDAIKEVYLFNDTTETFDLATNYSINRLCSADLAPVSAYYWVDTNGTVDASDDVAYGTQSRIFMTGEESGTEGKEFAVFVTGPDAGKAFEFADCGLFAWENNLASPFAQKKTITVGQDDGLNGQVYVYVGEKQATGSEFQKAGLEDGHLFGIHVDNLAANSNNESDALAANGRFSMVDEGVVGGLTGAQLDAASEAAGVTSFQRPEDGHWDTLNPNVYWFVTTASATGQSRLYKMTYDDITQPELGGTIEAVLDSNQLPVNSTVGVRMMDNITVNGDGKIIIQEDIGNNAHLGRILEYDPVTDTVTVLAVHDGSQFVSGQPGFLTQDEEASGIIDVTEIFGRTDAKVYLSSDQIHTSAGSAELVEKGQLLLITVEDDAAQIGNSLPVLSAAQAVLAGATEDQPYTVTTAQLVQGVTDADGDTLSVSGVSSNKGSVVDNGDGTWTITPLANYNGAAVLNFTVSDGNGGTAPVNLTYSIAAVNDAPTGLSLPTHTVAENAFNGTVVGTLVPTDVDNTTGFTYALLDTAGGRFVVNASTGRVSVSNGSQIDFETAQQYTIEARVTDAGGLSYQTQLTIDVTNVVENQSFSGTTGVDVFTASTPDNWTVDGKAGNDTITTLGGADTVYGAGGNDTISLGAGNDRVLVSVGGGFDAIDGGAGSDVVQANAANAIIGLSSIVNVETITSGGLAGVTISGSTGNDTLDFSATTLIGIGSISGGNGADTIIGSGGADLIIGGAGRDMLTGGAGSDTFQFKNVTDSGFSLSTPKADHILDFVSGSDIIDLHAIDANGALAGNQDFTFIGTANFTALGQVRIGLDGGHVALFANTAGNLAADFEIILDSNPTLLVTDLLL